MVKNIGYFKIVGDLNGEKREILGYIKYIN
jgi:hypothetical protein